MLFPRYMFRRRRRQVSPFSSTVLVTVMLSTTFVAFMPSPVSAKDSTPHVQLVRHGDLNLDSDKDVARLHRRISRAAKSLCSQPGIAAEIFRHEINDCVDETKAGALRNLEQKIALSTATMRSKN